MALTNFLLLLLLFCFLTASSGEECAGSIYCDEACLHFAKEQKRNEDNPWRVRYPTLKDIFEEKKCEVVVEIGVAFGGLTKYLLTHVDQIKEYHGVDPFLGGYDTKDAMSEFLKGELKGGNSSSAAWGRGILENLKHFKCRFKLHQGMSDLMAKDFKNNSVDCIFIDGDHTYKGVVKDLIVWAPIVKPGGIFLFDDYTRSYPGVVMAVDQFADNQKPELEFIKINSHNNYYVTKPLDQTLNLNFESFWDYDRPDDLLV